MKVILHHTENSGVSYYRMWMQGKYLKERGIDAYTFPDILPITSPQKWEEICRGADVFVTQKSDDPRLISLFMAIREQFNIPVVFEIDDDIYDISPNSPAYQFYYPGSPYIEMTEMVMQNVDAMTVSTQQLADIYSKHCKNIYILPNAQDPEDWRNLSVVAGKKKDQIVIGWAGSPTHYDDLKILARPMKKLLKKYPNVVFRVLGIAPDFLAGNPQIELRTDIAPVRNWPSKLANMGFDIGVVPVQHRNFNLGKSNIKWQEYSMLEIPTIASNLGEYKEINHGVDGFLSDNDENTWLYYLEKLVKDAELRQQIGAEAKRRVLTDFNIEKNIHLWESAYRNIAEQSISS